MSCNDYTASVLKTINKLPSGSVIGIQIVFLALTFTLCCSRLIITHNPEKASKAARDFVMDAFVEQDFRKATRNSLLDEETIRQLFSTMHAIKDKPITVIASAYEPVPGTRDIVVFVDGMNFNDTEDLYYRVLLSLSENNAYEVKGVTLIDKQERFRGQTQRRSISNQVYGQ